MHMGRIFQDMPYFKHGMHLALQIIKAKVPIITGVTAVEACGSEYVEKIVYTKNGKRHELAASALIRHEGIIPRIQIPSALDMQLSWDSLQRYWYPKTDEYYRRMQLLCKARDYLRYVFAPNPQVFDIPDDTVVCRCECVTAGEIRQAVKEGFPREVKIATRAGMGPCQGRSSGVALAEIIAQSTGAHVEQVGILKCRQPFLPVTLADYCALHV